MAKTIQSQLAEKIKEKFPEAEVKKVNQDNYVDIHLPGVHLKRGTHLFFNTAGGAIKLGFYCREEEFTQQVLAKNGNLEAYSQGLRLKGNPEWRKVDAACAAAFAFVESLTGFPRQGSSRSPRAVESGNAGSTLLQEIKAAYPKCSINEEKSYASFTFKSAFLYELRIQKGTIRLLAANYPQKASVAKCFELIALHDLFIHKIEDRYPVIVEPGKVSPDKLTIRIEIPYQAADLENEGFITNLITTCEQFHEAVAPLINGFQAQPVGTLSEVMGDGTAPKKTGEAAPKKEAVNASEEDDFSFFDLTEFDEEGRPVGMKDAPQAPPKKEAENPELDLNTFLSTIGMEEEAAPKKVAEAKEKPEEQAQFDESDQCLADPMPFLTCIQLMRFYYSVLSSDSKAFRASFEETLQEYTKAAVVPRITNKMMRLAHEDGNLGLLMRGPMQKSWEIYDKDFATHDDYVRSLAEQIEELVPFCNTGLFLDTLELFMYLGDMLEEEDSPTGSLAPQDRYFPLFLMLKASPEQDLENLEMVLSKDEDSRNAKNGCDVKSLLLKASGNFSQLSHEEKLALVLYDFILWDENPGLDIKRADIAAAKSIFTLVTQNAALGEKLVGGFNDNASFEIFQFFNVEFNREGFHAFCLERWKELSSEWNALKLQLLVEHVKRDFHPNTYINNPVLKDYLDVYGGVKVGELKAETTSPKAPDSQKIKTVKIGSQTWMAENLNTEFFANGDPIPHAESEEEWAEAAENSQPAWCYYDNDPQNGKKFGRLYNWYAVNDSRGLAPDSWRVATDEDWDELAETLGGEEVGKKIKSIQGWNEDGNGTDEVGFNALPGGLRDIEGEYGYIGEACYFWTSTEYSEENAADRFLNHDEDEIDSYDLGKSSGYYIRCIMEKILEIENPKTGGKLRVANQDFSTEMTWLDAQSACEDLGEGWRLPTIDELQAIHEQLHEEGEGNFKDEIYWSSTEDDDQYAKNFWFSSGDPDYELKSVPNYVRAVRNL